MSINSGSAELGATTVRFYDGSLSALLKQVSQPQSGPCLIVTPNLDHLRLLDQLRSFRRAYASADLIVNDSKFLDRYFLRGHALCAPGADIVPACLTGLPQATKVCVVGFTEAVRSNLTSAFPDIAFSFVQPSMGYIFKPRERCSLVTQILAAQPAVILICTGAPQSEIFAAQIKRSTQRNISLICCGSALLFLCGEKSRASANIRDLGLEWAFRFSKESYTRKRYARDLVFLLTKLRSFVAFRINGRASFGPYRLNA